MSSRHRECSFDHPAEKFSLKIWIFFAQNATNISYLINCFPNCSSRHVSFNFDIPAKIFFLKSKNCSLKIRRKLKKYKLFQKSFSAKRSTGHVECRSDNWQPCRTFFFAGSPIIFVLEFRKSLIFFQKLFSFPKNPKMFFWTHRMHFSQHFLAKIP